MVETESYGKEEAKPFSNSESQNVVPIPWDAIDSCVRGSALLKFGRTQGVPIFRTFSISTDCRHLCWVSKRKTHDSQVPLKDCRLLTGQATEVFKKATRPDLADVSFSLVWSRASTGLSIGGTNLLSQISPKRTVDVACKDRNEHAIWTTALRYLIEYGPPPESELAIRQKGVWADIVPTRTNQNPEASSYHRITRDLKAGRAKTSDVFTFGRNNFGECGLGREQNVFEPTIVSVLLGKAIKTISCGTSHCLALSESGECFAWGNGGNGRLGTGSASHELSPRQIMMASTGAGAPVTPHRFRSVSCGHLHSVGIGTDGSAWSWGANYAGEGGRGAAEDSLVPTRVTAFLSVCGTTSLPPNTTQVQPNVYQVGGYAPLDAAFGVSHGLSALSASPLSAFSPTALGGSSLSLFQNRSPNAAALLLKGSKLTPELTNTTIEGSILVGRRGSPYFASKIVISTPSLVSVAAGASYTIFQDVDGNIYSCGSRYAPLGHDVHALATLMSHSLTIKSASSRHNTVSITSGTVNTANKKDPKSPTGLPPPPPPGFLSTSSSIDSVTFLKEFIGPHWSSGAIAGASELDTAVAYSDLKVPLQIVWGDEWNPQTQKPVSLAAGEFHALFSTSDGKVFSWGWGAGGALGHGNADSTSTPTPIRSFPPNFHARQVAAGAVHSLVLGDQKYTPTGLTHPYSNLVSTSPIASDATVANTTPHAFPLSPTTTTATATAIAAAVSVSKAVPSTPEPSTSIGGMSPFPRTPPDNPLFQFVAQANAIVVPELYAFGSGLYGQVPAPVPLTSTGGSIGTSSRAQQNKKGEEANSIGADSGGLATDADDKALALWESKVSGTNVPTTPTSIISPSAGKLASSRGPIASMVGFDAPKDLTKTDALLSPGTSLSKQASEPKDNAASAAIATRNNAGIPGNRVSPNAQHGNMYFLPFRVDIPLAVPSDPSKPPTVPVAIAAGAFHSAVIASDGKMFTFGHGIHGELGNSASSQWELVQLANEWREQRKQYWQSVVQQQRDLGKLHDGEPSSPSGSKAEGIWKSIFRKGKAPASSAPTSSSVAAAVKKYQEDIAQQQRGVTFADTSASTAAQDSNGLTLASTPSVDGGHGQHFDANTESPFDLSKKDALVASPYMTGEALTPHDLIPLELQKLYVKPHFQQEYESKEYESTGQSLVLEEDSRPLRTVVLAKREQEFLEQRQMYEYLNSPDAIPPVPVFHDESQDESPEGVNQFFFAIQNTKSAKNLRNHNLFQITEKKPTTTTTTIFLTDVASKAMSAPSTAASSKALATPNKPQPPLLTSSRSLLSPSPLTGNTSGASNTLTLTDSPASQTGSGRWGGLFSSNRLLAVGGGADGSSASAKRDGNGLLPSTFSGDSGLHISNPTMVSASNSASQNAASRSSSVNSIHNPNNATAQSSSASSSTSVANANNGNAARDASAPLPSTLTVGPLLVSPLFRREVRAVACGNGFTVALVASEWMRNEDAPTCMRCSLTFSLTQRKHHCRRCGGVFCSYCSSHKLPLLPLGYITPVRVCDSCYSRGIAGQ